MRPAHEHNASAERNRVTSPISATNTAVMVADPGDRLHGPIGAIVTEALMDRTVQHHDLTVRHDDQIRVAT